MSNPQSSSGMAEAVNTATETVKYPSHREQDQALSAGNVNNTSGSIGATTASTTDASDAQTAFTNLNVLDTVQLSDSTSL